MTTYHECPTELLAGLARGGGPDISRALARSQVSKQILLITALLREWTAPAADRDHLVAALQTARTVAPKAAADVLGSPMVGAWAAIVVRALGQGRTDSADLAHLGAVASATCAATGVDADFTVPVRDGAVALPGLGLAAAGDEPTARVSVRNHAVTVGTGDWWQPVRKLRASAAGIDVELALDDVDPYRHGYHAPPAPRLQAETFDRWQDMFTEAWRLLATHAPDRADEIAAGLRVLVPLTGDGRSARSATIRHVFGVFGLTLPPNAANFAVTLVHEYQHAKLSALLDVVRLTAPDDGRRFFAPWRSDPRPLAGLLQGVYAFGGVADTWRALRAEPTLRDTADAEFADARLQVDRSLATLQDSGALTPEGERFGTYLRGYVDSLTAISLPEPVTQRAEQHHRELFARWSTANAA